LSRIIKKESLDNWAVCEVNYEALMNSDLKNPDTPNIYLEGDGFTPLFFNDHLGHESDSVGLPKNGVEGEDSEDGMSFAADIPDGMIFISEEELNNKLADEYTRGTEEGRQIAERGLVHVFKALREGADSIVDLRKKVMRESEEDLLRLSIMVARKIVLQEIRQDHGILANIVAATVSSFSDQENLTIRLNSADYQMVMANQQMLSGIVKDGGRVSFTPDDSVKLGGCLVETPRGTVDARIEAQLEEVYCRCMEEGGMPTESMIGVDNEAQVL